MQLLNPKKIAIDPMRTNDTSPLDFFIADDVSFLAQLSREGRNISQNRPQCD